jgi:hypothetical protein
MVSTRDSYVSIVASFKETILTNLMHGRCFFTNLHLSSIVIFV